MFEKTKKPKKRSWMPPFKKTSLTALKRFRNISLSNVTRLPPCSVHGMWGSWKRSCNGLVKKKIFRCSDRWRSLSKRSQVAFFAKIYFWKQTLSRIWRIFKCHASTEISFRERAHTATQSSKNTFKVYPWSVTRIRD